MSSNSINESLVFDLQISIKSNNLDRVQSILKSISQDDLNGIRFNDKWTPLGYAINIGFEKCVQLLLDYGSDPNIGRIETPFHTAIKIGDTKTIKLLLNCNNIDVNRTALFIYGPTRLCVFYRRPEYLQMIIRHQGFDMKPYTYIVDLYEYLRMLFYGYSIYYPENINNGLFECFHILINSGFKVNQQIIDYVIKSGNQTALKMIEMSTGKVFTSDGNKVPTLLQLTRVIIRDIYVENSGCPITISNIEECFPEIPHNLKYFLTDLCQTL